MNNNNFKVGDKVLERYFYANTADTIPTIVEIKHEEKKIYDCTYTTDCTIRYKTSEKKIAFDKIYKVDERTIELYGKKRWEIKGVKQLNGYFGSYSLIEYKGKKCIVFCDDRDAIVRFVTDWYDEIIYKNDWSGDLRWNNDKPIIVYDENKGYALNEPHTNNLITPFIDEITYGWKYNKDLRTYIVSGLMCYVDKKKIVSRKVYITEKGNILDAEIVDNTNFAEELQKVKNLTIEEIKTKWILNDKPCAYIKGLEFKGAKYGLITKEKALDLIKTHTNFKGMFESVEWTMRDGKIVLLFRDYCESDYD